MKQEQEQEQEQKQEEEEEQVNIKKSKVYKNNKKGNWVCKKCKEVFINNSELHKHQTKQHNRKNGRQSNLSKLDENIILSNVRDKNGLQISILIPYKAPHMYIS